jgi:glycerol-3-phosphate acyltransferase PlsY
MRPEAQREDDMRMNEALIGAGLMLGAYLLGSVSWGILFTRRLSSVDLMQGGSRNIGAANVARTAGAKLGALTLAADMLKAALPVWIFFALTDSENIGRQYCGILVAAAAFFGHLFPVYSGFKFGGKGVATAAGGFLALAPKALGLAVLVYIIAVAGFRRASIGSLAASAVLPFAAWVVYRSFAITGWALVAAAFIWMRHRDNIARIIAGVEPEFRFPSRKDR